MDTTTDVVSHQSHSAIIDGSTCLSCFDDLLVDNYVEYQTTQDSPWFPSGFCKTCVVYMINSQWSSYVKRLTTTNCKAEQRRMLERGPPINLKDSKALPCPNDGEVFQLWYMSDDTTHDAKLIGSLLGEERQNYWNELKAFYIIDESEDKEEEQEPISFVK